MAAKKVRPHLTELNLTISSKTPFKEVVKQLEIALTLPKGLAPRGCDPCLSGLDRFVLDSRILDQTR